MHILPAGAKILCVFDLSSFFPWCPNMDLTLTVLAYSAAAAAAAAIGALPLIGRERLPTVWIGWANALAAGTMLGSAYVLLVIGLRIGAYAGGAGALLGVLFIVWTHTAGGTVDLELQRRHSSDPSYGYKILLVNTLHSGSEGIAIGVAMVESLTLGGFVALAIAVHNVPEATILCGVLRGRGVRLDQAAGLAVVTKSNQVVMAVVAYAVVRAAPSAHPWALGFAVGALIHLVMLELLPESYRRAGTTSIALVTSVAMGMVVVFVNLVS